MKLNEWKCDMDINDADIYVEPTGVLNDMVEHFKLKYNPSTLSYDCDGDVELCYYYHSLSASKQIKFDEAFVKDGKITIKFGDVKGNFILPGNYNNAYILTSLEGCPKTVGGDFYCGYNQLTSLNGCPESIGGNFSCGSNQLTSLEGCPKTVGGDFDCRNNRLTSLEGCPKSVDGCFYCRKNRLTSLKNCPETVGGDFYCNDNQLTSLEGCPKSVGGRFDCGNNKAQFTKKDVTAVCDVKNKIYV